MPSAANSSTVRAGAYARYSSDSQRDASIDDQVRICRAEIERHGWDLTQVYADAGISGASIFRPGYQKLLLDASTGAIDRHVTADADAVDDDLTAQNGAVAQLEIARELARLENQVAADVALYDVEATCERAAADDDASLKQGPLEQHAVTKVTALDHDRRAGKCGVERL